MTIRAVIYDLDGTLVDSERLWHEAETSLLAVRGLHYYDEVRAALLGQRMDACIRIIRDHYCLSDSVTMLRSELLERMMALVERKLQKRPGAEELLARVKGIGLPAAIASSSPLSFIEGVVRSCGWDELYFPSSQNYLFSADDVPNGKPAPDVYLAAAKSLGIPPMECLAIEDSPTGARAAVAADMTCIAVWDSFHSKVDDFTDITPHCYTNLRECWSKIRDWAAR